MNLGSTRSDPILPPEEPVSPLPIKLDQFDCLLIENVMIKEECESYRKQLLEKLLVEGRENLNRHIISKYKIDMSSNIFQIENGNTLVIKPK